MKKFLLVAFFILFFLTYKRYTVFAQNTSQTATATKPVSRCLNSVHCLKAGACTVVDGHRARLTSTPSEPPLSVDHPTYITVCFSYIPTGASTPRNVCTTENPALDKELFGVDNYSKLQKDLGLSLTSEAGGGLYKVVNGAAVKIDPPATVKTDAKGYIPTMEMHDYTPKGQQRHYVAYQIINVEPAIRTKEGGQQQAVMDVIADPQVCAPVAWDPDGRVFDSITLDPVPGATVSLLKNYNGVYQNALQSEKIVNPQFTSEDGKFSFFVTDGDYKLMVTAPVGYTFPVKSLTGINPNYKKIYVNPDAFPPSPTPANPIEPATKIYSAETGEVITVKGRPQHADIPVLYSKQGGMEHKKVVVTSFAEQRIISGGTNIQGEVSHPFAKITVYVVDKYTTNAFPSALPKTYRTDRDGRFNISLDKKVLPEGKMFDHVEFEAADLTGALIQSLNFKTLVANMLTKILNRVEAQTTDKTSVKLAIIPGLLDGYAYDLSGKIIANAKVGIYLTFSEKASFETSTDEKGYFKITSEYLPNKAYRIKYTSSSGVTTVSTPEEFIKQNVKYLTDNNINLFGYKDVKGQTKPPAFSTFGNNGSTSKQGVSEVNPVLSPGSGTGVKPTAVAGSGNMLAVLIVLLFLVGVVGLVVGIYLLKKHEQQPPPMTTPPAI